MLPPPAFDRPSPDHPVTPSPPSATLDLIASLVDKSLLRPETGADGEPRFAMLETVREYGLEQLAASGEEDAIRGGHAAWFLAMAGNAEPWLWQGTLQQRWLDRIEAELPNLRAALIWFDRIGDAASRARLATDLWGYWHLRNRRAEGRAWLRQALAHDIASDAVRARVLLVLSALDHLTGSAAPSAHLEQSLALSRSLRDAKGTVEALFMLGVDERNRGEFSRAIPHLQEAHEIATASGHLDIAALATLNLGVAALYQSGAARATPLMEQALALFRQRNDAYGIACALLVLGWAATSRRDAATAATLFLESLALWERLGTREGIADVLAAAAELAWSVATPAPAVRLLAAAAALGAANGYVIPPAEQARYARVKIAAREALGDSAFAAAWAAGTATSPEDAAAEARTLLSDLAARSAIGVATFAPSSAGLTPREQEVLRLVVAGYSNPQIAGALFVSRRTVTTHLTRIFAKLGVTSRAEAAVLAVRQELV